MPEYIIPEKRIEQTIGIIKLVGFSERDNFLTSSKRLRLAVKKYPNDVPYPKIIINSEAK